MTSQHVTDSTPIFTDEIPPKVNMDHLSEKKIQQFPDCFTKKKLYGFMGLLHLIAFRNWNFQSTLGLYPLARQLNQIPFNG